MIKALAFSFVLAMAGIGLTPAPVQAPAVVLAAPQVPSVKGLATWYNAARRGHSSWYTRNGIKLYAAAGPALRRFLNRTWERGMDGKRGSKWRHAWVTITSVASGKSATFRVLDWCGCHGRRSDPDDTRLVDLSPHAWRAIDQHFVRNVRIRRATAAEILAWKDLQTNPSD